MNNFTLKNKNTLSIIGHVIISNNNIHDYQIRYIKKLLEKNNLIEEYSYIENVFSGSDKAIGLKDSIYSFNKEYIESKEVLYKEITIISALDGNIDNYEKDILKQLDTNIKKEEFKDLQKEATKISGDYTLKFQENDKKKRSVLNKIPRELEIIENLTKIIRNIFVNANLKQRKPEETDNYEEVYDEIIKIGKEDYKIVEPIYQKLLNETDKIYRLLDQELEDMNGKLSIEKDLKDNISGISKSITKNVRDKIKDTLKELYIKENALEYFTISFLGRTKAGKSTLHTILTGEGSESIGEGKQRTTRYNRVYQLDKLRLIDTPGIGAAEAEGRTDEEIAMSVIGESDIICIVVSDDSVQEYIFELAEKIIKRNKPVIIALNHKQNLRNDLRYKLFKRDPHKWLKKEGTKGVLGHVKRIDEYAKKNKFEDMIKSYPLFLLPALIAMEDEYKEDKSILRSSSNINEFKKGIKDTILTVGTLLRSQTIIDDSRALFMQSREELSISINKLQDVYGKFGKSKNDTTERLERSQKKLIKNCKSMLENSYFKLENTHALAFAENNYESKDLNKQWEIFLSEIKFNDTLKTELEINFNEFNKEVKEALEETLEDFKIGINNYTSLNDMDNLFLNLDFKKIGTILSRLGSVGIGIALLAGVISAPLSIGLGVIAGIIGAISGGFKSKARKRQEAIDKLYEKLKENIRENKDKNIEGIINDIYKESTDQLVLIEGLFENIEKNLKHILDSGKDSLKIYDEKIYELDLNYSWRIFNYLSNENIEKDEMRNIITNVDRKYGEYIKITVNYDGELKTNNDDLIREKITIKNIKL